MNALMTLVYTMVIVATQKAATRAAVYLDGWEITVKQVRYHKLLFYCLLLE